MRHIAQAFHFLGQVALEIKRRTVSSLLYARFRRSLCCGQALLGGQQDHLRARPKPSLAGGAVQLLQSVELLRV
jgi:hypothetical protein